MSMTIKIVPALHVPSIEGTAAWYERMLGWIYVEDMDAIYRRVVEQEWPVETAVEDQLWGERLFKLRDLNGNQLVITQSIEDIGLEKIRERHQKLLNEAQNG